MTKKMIDPKRFEDFKWDRKRMDVQNFLEKYENDFEELEQMYKYEENKKQRQGL